MLTIFVSVLMWLIGYAHLIKSSHKCLQIPTLWLGVTKIASETAGLCSGHALHLFFLLGIAIVFFFFGRERWFLFGIDNCTSCVAHTWDWILDAFQGGELDGHMDDTMGRVLLLWLCCVSVGRYYHNFILCDISVKIFISRWLCVHRVSYDVSWKTEQM